MEKHLENIGKFKVVPVIAINKFATDTDEEIAVIKELAASKGVRVAVANVWAKGGEGAEELAKNVIDIVDSGASAFQPLYDWKSFRKGQNLHHCHRNLRSRICGLHGQG